MATTYKHRIHKSILINAVCCFVTVGNLLESSQASGPAEMEGMRESCNFNAVLGSRANPFLTRICASMGLLPSAVLTPPCKPIPPRSNATSGITMEMSIMLQDGVNKMNQQSISANTDLGIAENKAIFVLGNTGSGKTTATQIIAGDLNRLHASFTEKRKLVIIDDDNRIGAPTTRSKTLVPEYVYNSEIGMGFWDCPGFDYSRGPEVDLAAMYFLKNALGKVNSAKFLLTVSHSSVQAGNDRLDFDLLATHATKLFKTVTRLQTAIGLVVTKVGSYSAASGEPLSDEQILAQVREFMEKYVETKREDVKNMKDETERNELENKINLIEGILGKGSNYSKLYFVRSPENCGPLGGMSTVHETRRKLREMISRLEYVSVIPEDFRVTLKAETRLQLETQWMPENSAKILECSERIGTQLDIEFRNKFYKNGGKSPEENLKLLNHTVTTIQMFLNVSRNYTTAVSTGPAKAIRAPAKEPINVKIGHLYENLKFDVNCTEMSFLQDMENQHKFFEMVTSGNAALPNWTAPISNFFKEVGELQEFYQFCNTTEVKLAEYSSQLKLRTLLDESKNNRVEINEEKLLSFLNKHGLVNVSTRIFSLWGERDTADRNYLTKRVLEDVPNVNCKCAKSNIRNNKMRLTVTGRNIIIGDAFNVSRWPSECTENSISEVSVVALERVYLNSNVNGTGKEWHVSIIAPTWEVVIGESESTRTILLDGLQPADQEKAAPGADWGDRGKNGADGKSGGNAGSFFGVYENLVGGDKLFVSANGGNGGNGQDGGDGHDGKPGGNATYDQFPSLYGGNQSNLINGYYENNEFVTSIVFTVFYNKNWRTLMGGNGTNGGNGGNSGNGGNPGNPGMIQIISLGEYRNEIRLLTKQGIAGLPGLGGVGGKGGKNGDHYSCKINNAGLFGFWWSDCYTSAITTHGPSGTNGRSGETGNDNKPTESVYMEKWRGITEYRVRSFQNKSKSDFDKRLDSSQEIIRIICPKSFAMEIEITERNFYHLWNINGNQETFLVYYENFLDRLISYNLSLPDTKEVANDRFVLNLISSMITGKIVGIRRTENRLNVLDTAGCFATLKDQITTLNSAKKEKVIGEISGEFKATLNEKVNEAAKLIQETVQPAIKNAQMELQELNDKLLQEVNQLLRSAEADVEKAKKAYKTYQDSYPLNTLMSVLSCVGSTMSFFGPVGMAIGSSISTGASITKSFLPAQKPRGSTYPSHLYFKTLNDENKDYYEAKIGKIQKQVDMARDARQNSEGNFLQDVTGAADKTSGKLEAFKTALAAERNGGALDKVTILKLEKDVDKSVKNLKKAARQKADQLEENLLEDKVTAGEKAKEKQKMKRNDKIVRNLAIGLQVADSIKDIALDISERNSELERLAEVIKQEEEKVKRIEERKDSFYENVLPALEKVKAEIEKESNKLPGESQVSLSVKKWKITGLLKMMRGYVQKFSDGLKVAESFRLSFDALDEAFSLLIEMYDHIERYAEQKQLADFIANVNSASGSKSEIKDEELKRTLERLEFYVQANLFYGEYQKAMHAFKQWVFPFASSYLATAKESPWGSAGLPNNLEDVTEQYTKQISGLHTELQRYKTITTNGDEFLIAANFSSSLVSSKPFFVWQNSQWQGSIKKLLAGEKIHLKADVEMMGQNEGMKAFFKGKSAVKFKTIWVMLKAKNQSEQGDLTEKLNHFKMKMTHSGISIYKVGGQQYVMLDRNQTYKYSFEATAGGHVSMNVVGAKAGGQNADFLMSPYTWWILQLMDAIPGAGLGFQDLVQYRNKVDLELVGQGIYFDELHASNQILENLNLSEYYKVYIDDEVSSVENKLFGVNTCPQSGGKMRQF